MLANAVRWESSSSTTSTRVTARSVSTNSIVPVRSGGMLSCSAMQLRPSLKLIKLSYMFCLVLAVAIAVYLPAIGNQDVRLWGLMAAPAVLALITVVRHIQRRLVKLTILG